MKILWIHNWPEQRKNMGPFMWTVFNSLKESGHQIDMYYFEGSKGFFSIVKEFFRLKKIASEYDLIHSQYGSLVGFVGSSLGLPHIITIRGSDWHRYRGENYKEYIHSLFATWLTRRSVKKSKHAVVMSKRMAKEVSAFDRNINIHVIMDPIDISIFRKMDKSACRARLGFKDDRSKWILFNTLSEDNPVKRIFLARAAVEFVREEYPDANLKIATGIKYDDMPVFINACDLVLCTSTHEGWPNSIKEALACNLPFVSTDVSDLEEISLTYKSCKVTSDDPKKIARAIIETLSNKEEENYGPLVKSFDMELSTQRYINLYRFSEKMLLKPQGSVLG